MNQKTQEAEEIFVHNFPLNERENVQFAWRRYNGKFYVDLRVWFHEENDSRLKPSRKGFTVGMDHLPSLQEGLLRLREAALKSKQESLPESAGPAKSWKRYSGVQKA